MKPTYNKTPLVDGSFYDIETCDGIIREAEFDFVAMTFIAQNGVVYTKDEVTNFELSA